MQHGMIWISQGLMPSSNKGSTRKDINHLASYSGAMAQSPSDAGAEQMQAGDLETGRAFGQRVAALATRFLG